MLAKTTFGMLVVLAIAAPALGSSEAAAQAKPYVNFECSDETRPEIFRPQNCPERLLQIRRARVFIPPPPPPPPTPEPPTIFDVLDLDSGGGDGDGGGGGGGGGGGR